MKTIMRIALASSTVLLAIGWAAMKTDAVRAVVTPSASKAHLAYLLDGQAEVPANYREWPFLSAGANMNYSPGNATPDHPMFDNVFVNPESLRALRITGKWPDGTVLVKEERMGSTKGSINKSGQFQTEDVMAIELHVKDTTRFKGGWAFFMGDGKGSLAQMPVQASCYVCHESHGAVDSTFVQFYPTLIAIARKHATFSAAYLHDLAKGTEVNKDSP